MRERIARAIDPTAFIDGAWLGSDIPTQDEAKAGAYRRADAVLVAMRPATRAMVEAGSNCPIIDYDGNDPNDVWEAMIDAAKAGAREGRWGWRSI